jgi:predicted SAM-dependent methyltransferase
VGEIRRYLDEREARRTRGLRRGVGAALLRRVTTFESRQAAKVQTTKLLAPLERRRARRFDGSRPLRLHIGSGANRLDGWVNVDLVGMQPDLHWDLTKQLPFDEGSAEAVFLEHVLEHFPLTTDLGILAECRRLLAPGGIVRCGVPDFGAYARSYAGDRELLERLRPGRPTPLLALAEVALEHGHRSIWDAETLERTLAEAGFLDVEVRAFGDSAIEPAPDSPEREAESVYAEGRRG